MLNDKDTEGWKAQRKASFQPGMRKEYLAIYCFAEKPVRNDRLIPDSRIPILFCFTGEKRLIDLKIQ